MQEINLLQTESHSDKRISFDFHRGGRLSVYIVFGLLILEILFYGFFFFSERKIAREDRNIDQRSADIDLEISKIDKQRLTAISVQSRLKNLDVLLASHLLWSKVFAELESKTYKSVSLESLQVDELNDRFVLTGLAPSQTDVAKFMLGLKTSPYFQTVNLRTSTAQQTEKPGYNFHIDATFDPKLLRQ